MTSPNRTAGGAPPGRAGMIVFGAVFVAAGAAILAVALGILPARMSASPWVVASAGTAFLACGALVIFEALSVHGFGLFRRRGSVSPMTAPTVPLRSLAAREARD